LAAEIDQLKLTLRQRGSNGGQLLALVEKFLFFWLQPPDDRTWHRFG
jgi:hypothetical protein